MKSLPEYLGYPRIDIDDPEFQDMYIDYVKGLITGGVVSGYHTLHAVARGDWDEVSYWIRVELAVLATQYTALQFLNLFQGPKYAMSFHRAHAGLGPARGLILRAFFGNPVVSSITSASAQAYVWNQIGDSKTGATHYAGAGSMSGGSLPVVPSDNRWWQSWELPW